MDKNETKKVMKKLQKKPKRTLKMERQELQDIQEVLRIRKAELNAHKDKLKDDLVAACKANDGTSITLLERQIKDVEEDIDKVCKEYKENSDILEVYSRVLKNDADARSSNIGAIVGAVTGAGALVLGGLSLKKAYHADEDGTMKNKGVLDFFYRLNPLKLIGGGKK